MAPVSVNDFLGIALVIPLFLRTDSAANLRPQMFNTWEEPIAGGVTPS
jgi:hypothetical protein